ncbi:hypothetical protein GOP47_0024648, partial [Adiantum capillus-veneris]
HNLLYPCEGKVENTLLFACRNHCEFEERLGDNNCVYRLELDRNAIQVNTHASEDNTNEPGLARTKAVRCPACNHDEAFFFKDPRSVDDGAELTYICCNVKCNNSWRK